MARLLRSSVLLLGLGTLGTGHCDPLDAATSTLPDSAEIRFEFLDVNRDGVLSKYEYDSDVAFATADIDRNQRLSADELQTLLGPQAPGTPTASERITKADLDRDGQLDDGELRRVLEMRFNLLDRNGDGGLNLEEMQAGFGVRVRP